MKEEHIEVEGVVETVGKEMREGILVGVCPGRAGGDAHNAQRKNQRQQALAEASHI